MIVGQENDSLQYNESDYWMGSISVLVSFIDEFTDDLEVLKNDENVDIVIATPGKLVDYIKTNPSFNIQNLQYLVVDEADKLLLQSFDNWIHVVSNTHTLSQVVVQSTR